MTKPPLFIPSGETLDKEVAFDRFLDYVKSKNLELYDAQEEAILELFNGNNVILNTPTGSGKSLVAAASHYYALASGQRSFYSSPVKALVNEKFFSLCRDFGAERVGLITGDAKVNPQAAIICCTAEILANMALKEGADCPAHDVVIDEFHYYSDRDRGTAWQVPLLTLSKSRFLLMSATFGDTDFFRDSLTDLNGKKTVVVASDQRPVPLTFLYSEQPVEETLQDIIVLEKAPVYVVHFTQREAASLAQSLMSFNFSTKEDKKQIALEIQKFRFTSPYGKEISKYLRHGVGLHHAGILPKYRILTEQLAQKGLLKVICGTDTLGVGVNIPIRSVLLTKMCKFDGRKTALLTIRDFKQICGRAGRKGFDNEGFVYVQAPEHIIENKKLERKAKLSSGKKKKFIKAKPPEKGYVPWDENTFQKYLEAPPETLRSSFNVSHALILNMLSGDRDGCDALRALYRKVHESPASKAHLRTQGFLIMRSLIEKKIVEIIPKHERIDSKVRLNFDLQDNFSLTEPLSLFLLDIVKYLDPMDELYDLNLLSLVESIIENPDVILRKQLDKIKQEKVQELKAEGMDYTDRLEALEELEHPKPLRDFLYTHFNDFSAKYPWLATENVRPKSIVREMYGQYHTFSDYIREYGLQRSEGILLRYLSSVYKILVHTIPDHVKNDAIDEIIVYLKTEIKNTDSSLLDEWEKIQHPEVFAQKQEELAKEQAEADEDITRDERTLVKYIRNKVFRFVKALSLHQYDYALEHILPLDSHDKKWTAERLEQKIKPYYDEHKVIMLGREGRNAKHMSIKDLAESKKKTIELTLVDPDNLNDWMVTFLVDLIKSKEDQDICLQLIDLAEI